ncbi:MAG: permease-like cell division protein FtsX [Clostridia bacterium]|nr:permease-like cell division protein FtsX [Clostridia bacterium]
MFKWLTNCIYLTKEGIRNLWCNRMMTFASIGVLVSCMLLSGGSMLISLNIANILKQVEKNNLVMVYLNDDVTELEAIKVGTAMESISNILEKELITRDEALRQMMEKVENADALLEELLQDNPLPNSYRVTLTDLSKYDQTIEELKALEDVQSVRGESETSQQLVQIEQTITGVLLWIILLLVIVSLFIITNTIRVTMYNRRREISIMKSVGATDWFIRIPFIVEGAIIGVLSALLATLLLGYAYTNIDWGNGMVLWDLVAFENYKMLFLTAFTVAGIVFGSIGSVISIGRYLKDEGGDVFE